MEKVRTRISSSMYPLTTYLGFNNFKLPGVRGGMYLVFYFNIINNLARCGLVYLQQYVFIRTWYLVPGTWYVIIRDSVWLCGWLTPSDQG